MSYFENGYLSPQPLSKDKRSFNLPYTVSHSQSHSYQQHYAHNHQESMHRKSLDFSRLQPNQHQAHGHLSNESDRSSHTRLTSFDSLYEYDPLNDVISTGHSSLLTSPQRSAPPSFWQSPSTQYDEQWRPSIDIDQHVDVNTLPLTLSPNSQSSQSTSSPHIPIFTSAPSIPNHSNETDYVEPTHYHYPSDNVYSVNQQPSNEPTHHINPPHLHIDTSSQSHQAHQTSNMSHEAMVRLAQDLLTRNIPQQVHHVPNMSITPMQTYPHQTQATWAQPVSISAPSSVRARVSDHVSGNTSLLCDSTLVQCPVAMCAFSLDGLIAEGNIAFLSLFNIPSASHLSRLSLFSLVHPATISLLLTWMNEIVAGASTKQGRITARKLSAEAILSPIGIGIMTQPAREAVMQDRTFKRPEFLSHCRLHQAMDTAAFTIHQQLKSKYQRAQSRGQHSFNLADTILTDQFLLVEFPLTSLCIPCHFILAPIRDSDNNTFAFHLTIEPLSEHDLTVAQHHNISNIHELLKTRMMNFEPGQATKKRKRKVTTLCQPAVKMQKLKLEEKPVVKSQKPGASR